MPHGTAPPRIDEQILATNKFWGGGVIVFSCAPTDKPPRIQPKVPQTQGQTDGWD